MKAIIVDDEMLARKRIFSLLKKVKEIEVIKECSTGKAAITEINHLAPELVFLDINMKDLNGFEVLQKIDLDPKPIIIFVTAHDQHALKAFDVDAFDFLLKPFKEERFFKSMRKILDTPQMHKNELFEKRFRFFANEIEKVKSDKPEISQLPIRLGNKTILLKTSKIRYILASGYYAEIYTKDKKHVIRDSLSNLSEILGEEKFFRVHRSAIVNLNYIQEIVHSDYSEIDVRMKDNKLISISKSQKKDFLKKLGF